MTTSSSIREPSMQQTKWRVITGAPCSGKTAVIQALERLGYPVVHEVARAYIDERLRNGETLAGIKADILSFERHILHKKIEIEQTLPQDKTVYLDRAVPDSIGYYIHEGLDPGEPIQRSKHRRYERIFFFERIPFKKDSVRSEDEKIAVKLEGLLKESYQMLGYEVIAVPLMPVHQRVDFILS